MMATTAVNIQTRTVEYEHGGTTLRGFLACDEAAKDERPGVLVFSEWWGLNENARKRARRLAELGYVAFAADVYGDGRVIDIARPADAAAAAAALRADPKTWRGRADAAMRTLAGRPGVDPARVAAIGHCLDSALQLAYAGADLRAVATFHSLLPTPTDAEATGIKARLLVCRGGADPFVADAAVAAFRVPLDAAGVGLEVVTYPGVGHSFTSPGADQAGNPDLRYDASADEDSWERMKALLAEKFGVS